MKVFKTTLNEFKTRDRYIKDDHRFRDRFSKQNPRKVIRLWAEKEMCNLSRLVAHTSRNIMFFCQFNFLNEDPGEAVGDVVAQCLVRRTWDPKGLEFESWLVHPRCVLRQNT